MIITADKFVEMESTLLEQRMLVIQRQTITQQVTVKMETDIFIMMDVIETVRL